MTTGSMPLTIPECNSTSYSRPDQAMQVWIMKKPVVFAATSTTEYFPKKYAAASRSSTVEKG